MMGNLGATLDEIAWVSTGYIVANVIVLPVTSWFADRFGRRNYYTGSIILFTTASFFCGHATTLYGLVGWRVVQGLGGGALISTAQAILFDVFPVEERGQAMAIFGMGVMVGPTLGPDAGRLADRQLLLALDLLHQHSAGGDGRLHDLAQRAGAGPPGRTRRRRRLAGSRLPDHRHRGAADPAGAGRVEGLVQLARNPVRDDRRRHRAHPLRLARADERRTRWWTCGSSRTGSWPPA